MTNFKKMHGLGNDFVIIDTRHEIFSPSRDLITKLSNRRTGIGFDQLVLIHESLDKISDLKITIFNADGSEAESCGNASRCVGKLILDELGKENIIIETKGGLVDIEKSNGKICVDMGLAKFNWDEIPLSHPQDSSALRISQGYLKGGFSVNIGNPHVIFFSDTLNDSLLIKDCESVSKSKIFPKGVNISVVKVISEKLLELVVYERGCGFTPACGTAACASLVTSYKLNYCDRNAKVLMPGGELEVEFMSDGHVLMTGPVTTVYNGNFNTKDLT